MLLWRNFSLEAKIMRITQIIIAVMLAASLTDCASYDFSRRITQQGNLIPATKLERLKLGMSKSDVSILMGTSMLSPMFSTDRWDYAYTWRKGSNAIEKRNAVLYFSKEKLVRIEHKP
jgi:outer membrane protein assembly factor BamE